MVWFHYLFVKGDMYTGGFLKYTYFCAYKLCPSLRSSTWMNGVCVYLALHRFCLHKYCCVYFLFPLSK